MISRVLIFLPIFFLLLNFISTPAYAAIESCWYKAPHTGVSACSFDDSKGEDCIEPDTPNATCVDSAGKKIGGGPRAVVASVDAAGVPTLQKLFLRIINISVGIAFIALVVVLVYAGIRYITSGGEAKALSSASATITWGLLGILFLVISWLILQLIGNFTGTSITNFCIGPPC